VPATAPQLRRGIIHLLLHLPFPPHDHEVLWRHEDEPGGPDLHVDRILATLELDLAAERLESAGGAVDRVQPVVVARKHVERRALDGMVEGVPRVL